MTRMIENKDYELIPGDGNYWNIRILTGDYIETEFRYNTISIKEDEKVHYETEVVKSTRGEDWEADADIDWHFVTAEILTNIFEIAAENSSKH